MVPRPADLPTTQAPVARLAAPNPRAGLPRYRDVCPPLRRAVRRRGHACGLPAPLARGVERREHQRHRRLGRGPPTAHEAAVTGPRVEPDHQATAPAHRGNARTAGADSVAEAVPDPGAG